MRRFRCATPSCPRRIFTERFPTFVRPWAQRTERLRQALTALGLATSGQQGARLATRLGIAVAGKTVIRCIMALPPPFPARSRVVGIDEWSYRRGHRYGTILVDLERRQVLELLPERRVEEVATWIRQHPDIQIVSRDRGGIYAEGVRQGQATIRQVADRWHLLKNLGDALERFVVRTQLSRLLATLHQEENAPREPVLPAIAPQTEPQLSLKQQHRFAAIHELLDAGTSVRRIAQQLGLARNTVRRYARMPFPITRRPARRSKVDAFRAYLAQRWCEGCTNAHQLFQEAQGHGYQGGYAQIKALIAQFRQQCPAFPLPPPRASPREIRWLLARTSDRLTPAERDDRLALLAASPDAFTMFASYHAFWALLITHRVGFLEAWLTPAEGSEIPELSAFAAGIRRDYAAVAQAIGSPWSQGQVEGQVTRLKLIKRQMYGRAGFPLLRQRVLHHI